MKMNQAMLEILEKRDNKRTLEFLKMARQKEFEVCVWGCGKIGRGFGKEILDFLGVSIDYYCDSNSNFVGAPIFDNVFCKNKEYLVDRTEHTICFVLIGYADIESACANIVSSGIANIVTFDDLCELEIVQEHFLLKGKDKRIAVYTSITNEYDYIRKHEYVSDKCDYYVISDCNSGNGDSYTWIKTSDVVPDTINNPIHRNRYCKMHPHLLFRDYQYSIYIDGNITLTGNLESVTKHLRRSRMATAAGNFTDNYYAYAMRCMNLGADYEEIFRHQILRYKNQGLPADSGSYLCNILIREHNNPIQIKLMEDWWAEFTNGARRDQISLPYVLWKNGYCKEDVFLIANEFGYGHYDFNPFWKYQREHQKKRFKID